MTDVLIQPFGHILATRAGETILAAALRSGLYLKHACRKGGCSSCKCRLLDGDVEIEGSSFALTAREREEGFILACRGVAVTDCEIDIGDMQLSEDEFSCGAGPARHLATVTAIETLTADIRRLRLVTASADGIGFRAGQFLNVYLPGSGESRTYSIASPPSAPTRLDLIVRLIPGGRFSGWLAAQARPGDGLEIEGPFGDVHVRLTHRAIVMVAGGSGLGPLLSMLGDLAAQGCTRPIRLFFGVRRREDLYLAEEVQAFGRDLQDFRFFPVLSAAAPADWTGHVGLVTDTLAHELPYSNGGYDGYLCGPRAMIDAAVETLRARGTRDANIHFDAFEPSGGH